MMMIMKMIMIMIMKMLRKLLMPARRKEKERLDNCADHPQSWTPGHHGAAAAKDRGAAMQGGMVEER